MFEAKMTQASTLKKIVETIKDLMPDAPFNCTDKSMSLRALCCDDAFLLSLKLDKSDFDSYRCDRTISLGLSVADLAKVLKCAKAEDTLTLRYDDEKKEDSISFLFEHAKVHKQEITMKLRDLDSEHLGIPDLEYSCVVEMPTAEFIHYCVEVGSFADTLQVVATKSGVIFSGKGDTLTNTVTYSCEQSADSKNKEHVFIEVKNNVKLQFSIKYVTMFAKASSLSDRVKISLCNEKLEMMVLEFGIADNSYLQFYLAPKIDEDNAAMD